jgi:hypothetical protein
MSTSFNYFREGLTILDTTGITNGSTASLVTFGGFVIENTTDSTGYSAGSFVNYGATALNKVLYATNSFHSGVVTVTNTIESTDTNTGALIVNGGLAVKKDCNFGADVTITGDLLVNGVTTTVTSTTVNITDNTFLVNSGPSGSRDGGFLIQRYQIDNDTGAGDVVSAAETPAATGTLGAVNTVSVVELPAGFSAVDDFYNNYWIKFTSGPNNTFVRKITDYDGTTKNATLSSVLGTDPIDNTDTFNLYSNTFAATYYDESTDEYTFSYLASVTDIITNLDSVGYMNVRVKGLYAQNVTTTNLVATAASFGSLSLSGATFANLLVTNTGTINNSYFNNSTVANLVVNTIPSNPSLGDIITEESFTAANGQASPAAVTGLAFNSALARSFRALVSVSILTAGGTNDKFANFTLNGIQKTTGWVLNSSFVGDNTQVVFSITSAGNLLYTSNSVGGFLTDTIKFRAQTTSV